MLGLFEAAAAGHDHFGRAQRHPLLDLEHGGDKAAAAVTLQKGSVNPNYLAVGGSCQRPGLEDPGPGRGHLREGARGDDGGHDIAAEGRAGLEQQALFRVDGEGGAVGGQAGLQARGHPGDEGPAGVGGPGQDDLRPVLPGQLRQGRGIGLFQEILEARVLSQVNLVSPGGQQGRGQAGDLFAKQDRGHGHLQRFGQPPAFAQQLGGHRGQDAAPLLGKDPDAVRRHRRPRAGAAGLRQGQGLHFADLDAGAAEVAALADDQGLALQLQDPEGTGLDALRRRRYIFRSKKSDSYYRVGRASRPPTF